MSRKAKSKQWWRGLLTSPPFEVLGRAQHHSSAVPGVAALGTAGALTAAFLMRKPLGQVSRNLLTDGAALLQHLSISDLLSLAGLERRRSALSTVGPALGAFVVGTAAGSVALLWMQRMNEKAVASAAPNREQPNPVAYSSAAASHNAVT
jgi:hypothetical protein